MCVSSLRLVVLAHNKRIAIRVLLYAVEVFFLVWWWFCTEILTYSISFFADLSFSNLPILNNRMREKKQKKTQKDNIYGVNFAMSFMAFHWYIDSKRDCGTRHIAYMQHDSTVMWERKRQYFCLSSAQNTFTRMRIRYGELCYYYYFLRAILTIANGSLFRGLLARSIKMK